MFLPPLKNELLYEHFARIATATQNRRIAVHVYLFAALAAKHIAWTCTAIVAILQQNIALAHLAKYCPIIFTSLDTHCTPASSRQNVSPLSLSGTRHTAFYCLST
jgi:hypothetical protein